MRIDEWSSDVCSSDLLQQDLLHALARHVAGDRRVVGLAADLVDLIDIDDAALRPLDIVVGRLQQLEDDVLDILADIAGLGQRGGVGHRERHVDDAGQRLRQQGLAARSEERRVGNEWVSTWRSRWVPSHKKKNSQTNKHITAYKHNQ